MSMPGVQIPHCAAPWSRKASWRVSSEPRSRAASDRPSTVRTIRPSTWQIGTRQASTTWPSRSTEQAPHSPSPQPSFVPVSPRSSRRTSSSRRMPGHVDLGRGAVDEEPVRAHAAAPRDVSPVAGQRREDPLRRRGQLVIQTPVASWIAATTAGAADVHRQLADALRAVRRAAVRRLDEDRPDVRRVERGRDEVRREAVVEVPPVLELHLLDRRVADRLERAALDLALAQDRVDHLADVVDRDDVDDADLARVEVDLDASPPRPPSRRPGRRRPCTSRRRT